MVGLAFIGGGLYLGYQAWRERFLEGLRLTEMRAATMLIVGWLGRIGGVARGVVFVTVGVFLVVAAITAQPQQAKGLDSALRALAATPGGPWLLALVAIGSSFSARSRAARPAGCGSRNLRPQCETNLIVI